MKNICIVTPDIIGPITNGGIGTHCYWLAKLYAEQPAYRVSVLFTGPFERGSPAVFAKRFGPDIEFVTLHTSNKPACPSYDTFKFSSLSMAVYQHCQSHFFDLIHFQDWKGHGFHTIQAKRTGLGFERTTLALTLHSPSLWISEGSLQWPEHPVETLKLDYMERYCCAHADVVISPSHAMLAWAQAQGWAFTSRRAVIPYLMPSSPSKNSPPRKRPRDLADVGHVAFFGRLETRKGLEIFCQALNRLVSETPHHGLHKVSFVGKAGQASGQSALTYLKKHTAALRKAGIDIARLTQLDALEAIAYLQRSGAMAIMPSVQDNFPYTVLECLKAQIPFLAAHTGGIPEMVGPEVLFEPTCEALKDALLHRTDRAARMRPLYAPDQARHAWLTHTRAWMTANANATQDSLPASAAPLSPSGAGAEAAGTGTGAREAGASDAPPWPWVSICIAYYNCGAYLPQLLKSLADAAYPKLDVVVIDDGSTDPFSQQVYALQKETYRLRGWTFLSKANEGVGATRNLAASYAKGTYLIFMDADNIATPQMVYDFVRGMQASGADCLTCHLLGFTGPKPPVLDSDAQLCYGYGPLGPCIEVGLIENVFGDANFSIKRSVFNELGGFTTDRHASFEDWEFLAKLSLKGWDLDVIPKNLFYYRYLDKSFSRTTSSVANFQRIGRVYVAYPHLNFNRLINHLMVPLSRRSRLSNRLEGLMNAAKTILNHHPRIKKALMNLGGHAFKTYLQRL